ncbi:MAG: co-chaperone GroES [Candidatus Heimdallarchaeaceae archaeon]
MQERKLNAMIEALGTKVVVKLLRRNKTQGGIVLPNNSADPQGYGEVISVGTAIPTFPDAPEKNLEPGEKIVFHIRAGMDLVMENEILRCLNYDEIYGILTNEDFIDNLEEMTLGTNESNPQTNLRVQGDGGGVIVS